MADTVIASTANASMDDLPLWLQATGGDAAIPYSATVWRTELDGLFTGEGVLGSAAFVVTQRGAGANFSVDVAAGYAIVQGDSVANQGKYMVRSVGTVNVTTPAAPVSGTRIHRVIARIRDKGAAGTNYDWTLELLEDTGTGTPALPASAVHLALVSIAVGQASVTNANITNGQTQAEPYLGGIAWVDFSASAIVSAPGGYAKGSSTYAASYKLIGKTLIYQFKIMINTGGGFAAGAGTWSFLLPATLKTTTGVGSVWVNDSGTALRVGVAIPSDATHLQIYLSNISGNALDSNGPGTAWAINDGIWCTFTGEIA